MSESFASVLASLKAAAEPTRLRLLELLSHGELTVGEISTVLEQSQPRISRHLKMLCDAGVLDRFREEHWVYYRVSTAGLGHDFAQSVSGWLVKEDEILQADRRRMAAVLADRVKNVIASQKDGSSIAGELHDVLVDELGGEPIGELLDIGTGTGLILRTLGANATRAVGVDISTEALRIARTRTHGAGLSHCMFRRGDMYGLPFEAGAFDTVTMDRVVANAERPADAIAEASRTLRVGGRLCLVEDFDALADRVAGNPFAVIREWLDAAHLSCERIKPIDIRPIDIRQGDAMSEPSAHLLVVIARSSARAPARQAA